MEADQWKVQFRDCSEAAVKSGEKLAVISEVQMGLKKDFFA